jgi:hypothetical protein
MKLGTRQDLLKALSFRPLSQQYFSGIISGVGIGVLFTFLMLPMEHRGLIPAKVVILALCLPPIWPIITSTDWKSVFKRMRDNLRS